MNRIDNLRLEINSSGYTLSAEEREKLNVGVHTLARAVRGFPVADLHVDIARYSRSNEYHVRTNLRLTKRTLSTGQRDPLLYFAYERCISKLLKKLSAYKEDLANRELYQVGNEGGQNTVEPSSEPDGRALEKAVLERDFALFRTIVSVYDDALSARVGRWIQRYPEIQARVGREFIISDVVEEIYLNAFEQYESRPAIRMSEWLEKLIDPSLRALVDDPDERQNVSFAATAGE
jgi:hypothetical protein